MPITSLVFRVFVASPSDCSDERKIVREVATEWNAIYSLDEKAMIEPVFWESHSTPSLEDRGQAVINKQLVANCDLGIGFFWTRLGAPTGDYESGSVEEIEELRKARKPVLLYFSGVPVELDSVNAEEYARLKAFRSRMEKEGLYCRYESLSEFRKLVQRHLSKTITELLQKAREAGFTAPSVGTITVAERALSGYKPHQEFAEAINTFRVAVGRLQAEWRAEKDSEPLGVDEGKSIVVALSREATRLRSLIDDDDSESAKTLDSAAKEARSLQGHRLSLDGGKSYAEFWKLGDEVFAKVKTVPALMMAETMKKKGSNDDVS
jgi:hypothetical protein